MTVVSALYSELCNVSDTHHFCGETEIKYTFVIFFFFFYYEHEARELLSALANYELLPSGLFSCFPCTEGTADLSN